MFNGRVCKPCTARRHHVHDTLGRSGTACAAAAATPATSATACRTGEDHLATIFRQNAEQTNIIISKPGFIN